jgi:cell division protein FtsQ
MDGSLSARLGRSFAPAGAVLGRRGPARTGVGLSWRARQFWRRARLRTALLVLAGALALLGGGWLLLRHSALTAVERVQISGVHGVDAAQIDTALREAARHMSTLGVQRGALLAAVARYRVVRDLSLSPSFPHGLRIHVIEQPPVAVLEAGGTHTAVAADGVVLGPSLLTSSLPSIRVAGVEPLPGEPVAAAGTRAELSVLGAAPGALLGWVQRVFSGPEGLTLQMRDGLSIYFGNATRAHAKWLAAARVLADPSSAGATYLDVRLPERPAAGSTAPGGLAGAGAPATQGSASDPSTAALAATLDAAVAGGSSASASALAPSEPPAAAPSQAPAESQAEPAAGTQAQAPVESQAQPGAGTQSEANAGAPEPSASTSG